MKLRPLLVMLVLTVVAVAAIAPAAFGAAKAPKVTLKGPATVKAGAKATVRGAILPSTPAQAKSTAKVKILKLVNGAWKKVTQVAITWSPYAATGSFKAKVLAGAKGSKLKLKATWTAAKSTGVSKVVTIKVN